MHNLKLFEEDFDIIHGVSFGYKYCEDNLYIYGNPHGYIIHLCDFNHKNRYAWLRENVINSFLAVKPELTIREINDIVEAIIRLTRRYETYRPIGKITQSMCNQFQKLMIVYMNLTIESSIIAYRIQRKKFTDKFNWATYHFLINSIYEYDFNPKEYNVSYFNEYMERRVDKELVSAKYYDRKYYDTYDRYHRYG